MAPRNRRVTIKKRKRTLKDGKVRTEYLAYFKSRKPGQKYEYKTFDRLGDAKAYRTEVEQGIKAGTAGLSKDKITVEAAAALWLASPHMQRKERSTRDSYKQHLDNHVIPFFGETILPDIDGPMVTELEHWLETEPHGPRKQPCSSAMARKVMCTFRTLLGYMQRRGFVGRNIAREYMEPHASNGGRRKLEIGRDIPTLDEIRSIRAAADEIEGRWRPFLLTAIFTGLRASELRGLRWQDVDLDAKILHVRQRADRYKEIGPPKSGAGTRRVPLTPLVVNTLREWRLQCPPTDPETLDKAGDHLVFPGRDGGIDSHKACSRGFEVVQRRAGVMIETGRFDSKGRPILEPKYGLHALRHWFASWCINRVEDGGLGLTAKMAQERLGHSKISMTLDTYGHLFPSQDDDEALAAAERRLFG